MPQKILIIESPPENSDLSISFRLAPDGYVEATVTIAKVIDGYVTSGFDVATFRINDVTYTISNVTINKVKQVLKDIRDHGLQVAGYE